MKTIKTQQVVPPHNFSNSDYFNLFWYRLPMKISLWLQIG